MNKFEMKLDMYGMPVMEAMQPVVAASETPDTSDQVVEAIPEEMKEEPKKEATVEESKWLPRSLSADAVDLVSSVSKRLDYDVNAAMAFCVALLEDVNAHPEAAKVNEILSAMMVESKEEKPAEVAVSEAVRDAASEAVSTEFTEAVGLPFLGEAKEKWHIVDWTGAVKFSGKKFSSFEDAEEFLSIQLGDSYETDRGEFEIIPIKGTRDSRYLDPKDPRAGQMAEAKSMDDMLGVKDA